MQPLLARAICFSLLLALPSAASAQGLARSFEQLRSLIQPGDTARVIDAGGHEVRGRVRYLSPSLLVLQVGGAPRSFLEADVARIERRRNDSLANGVRLGATVGAGLSALAGVAAARRHGYPPRAVVPYVGLLGGIVGGTAGAVFDAAHAEERVVYSRHGVPSRVSLHTSLGPDRQGILATVRLGR